MLENVDTWPARVPRMMRLYPFSPLSAKVIMANHRATAHWIGEKDANKGHENKHISLVMEERVQIPVECWCSRPGILLYLADALTLNIPEMRLDMKRETELQRGSWGERKVAETLWKEHGSKWEVRKGDGESVRETVFIFVCVRGEKRDKLSGFGGTKVAWLCAAMKQVALQIIVMVV